jgi:hypothetical protein
MSNPLASDDGGRAALFWASGVELASVLSAPITPPIELVPKAARLSGDAPPIVPPGDWDGIAIERTAGVAAAEGADPLDGGGPAGDE